MRGCVISSFCGGRCVLGNLEGYRDHVLNLSHYIAADREPLLFRALLQELIALDELLVAHRERCRPCGRRRAR